MIDFSAYYSDIVLAVGGVFAYVGGRKMKTLDEKKAGSDALNSMQNAYNEFVIDQKERYQEIKGELNYVREELKSVKEESKDLRDEVKTWKTKYNSLKSQFEKYRAKHP
jgi:archaellum component FlaC